MLELSVSQECTYSIPGGERNGGGDAGDGIICGTIILSTWGEVYFHMNIIREVHE